MSAMSLLQDFVFLLVVFLLVKPLGGYMKSVFEGSATFPDRVLRPIKRLIYRLGGIDPHQEMSWRDYATSFIAFSFVGTLILYAILRLQAFLPWYHKADMTTAMTPDLAMNAAISFITTTTWQPYAGETTMSAFTQIVGFVGQNFLAGAAGLAVGIAFIRGFAWTRAKDLGNFWVDVTRATLWILIPGSILGSLALVWQGVPMNFLPYLPVHTLEGSDQIITLGPVAALEWIKNLGTNGGGYFNANGAHPFENPTPLTNFLEMLAIAVLPAALTNTFGRMVGNPRQGWVLFWVMTVLFVVGLAALAPIEQNGNPAWSAQTTPGGNMEGKETRFGIGGTVLTAIVTSNGATGLTNAMHDSFMPLGGLIPLVDLLLGEMVYGGLGTGVYSIVLVALVGLFIAGLMVGRTPEYLGKQIGPPEVKLMMLYTLATPFAVLIPTAWTVIAKDGLAGLGNTGPHGFTEILYAYASCMANNGQSFAGLSADTPFYNISTAIVMMIGRFGLAVPALALAARFASQGRRPTTLGTLPTDTFQFAAVIIGTAIIVGALSYLPALALGPIVEHFMGAHG